MSVFSNCVMDLNDLGSLCYTIIHSYSDDLQPIFASCFDFVKDYISNSQDPYIKKIQKLIDIKFIAAYIVILQKPIDTHLQFEFLKFFDFLFQTCGTEKEIDLLFRDGILNSLLTYPFDLPSIDILQSYMTILKGLSIHLKKIPLKYIYYEQLDRCPLFDHAIPYINHHDSTTVAAARFVVLNLFTSKIPQIIEAISSKPIKNHIDHSLAKLDSDGFSFIVDFLNVIPLDLREYTLKSIQKVLLKSEISYVARALTFLADSPARTMIMETMPMILPRQDIRSSITLSVILFCLEKKLIIYDDIIKLGLVLPGKYPAIQRFALKSQRTPTKAKFLQELAYVLSQRDSTTVLAIILRIFERISLGAPNIINSVKNDIIYQLKPIISIEIFELLAKRIPSRQRTDIDYILAPRREQQKSDFYYLVVQLAEIEASLARFQKKSFVWFNLATIDSDFKQDYDLASGTKITLTANELKMDEAKILKLWDLYAESSASKSGKVVTIWYNSQIAKRKSLTLNEKVKYVLQFNTSAQCSAFIADLRKCQIDLATETITRLE